MTSGQKNKSNRWSPFSWENYPVSQEVIYPDQEKFSNIVFHLKNASALVTDFEIEHLKMHLAKAAKGEAFILQGGDCSEVFSDCHPTQIASKFNILSQMSIVLTRSLKKPVIQIGRIAGQYAKPRSLSKETIGSVTLPAYRGDMINGYSFTPEDRAPDPERMLEAYECSKRTLGYLKELDQTTHANFFTSHEALHLPYEASLTREVKPGTFYNLSTHFPWIGMRTLHTDSAHVEYLKGISNPIGIKIGPHMDYNELVDIVLTLNPTNTPEKIVLIHRFGKENIHHRLPKLLDVLIAENIACAVMCDPMHGNTYTTKQGIKTRYFDDILEELHQALLIHQNSSIPLAGIHFEMTGEDVTECIGGSCGLQEEDLDKTYTSLVDPRLNYSQAMEMALHVAQWHLSR